MAKPNRLLKIAAITGIVGTIVISVAGTEVAMYAFTRGYVMGCKDAFMYDYVIEGIRTEESAKAMAPLCEKRAKAIWDYRHD